MSSELTGGGELPKDTLIFVKSKSMGEDSKGRTKIDLRFSEEETQLIFAELKKVTSRLKLQIHISDDTAFMFVKEVQERGASFGGGGSAKKATSSAPTKGGVSSSTAARVAALKGK